MMRRCYLALKPAAICRRRWLSESAIPPLPAPTSLSAVQSIASFRIVLDFLRHGISGQRLEYIGNDDAIDTQEKWAKAMQVLVGAQAHCASAFGYEASAQGVTAFRTHVAQSLGASDAEALEEMRSLEQDMWAEILLRCFSAAPKAISLKDARSFAGKVLETISDLPPLSQAERDKLADLSKTEQGHMQALQIVQRTIFEAQLDIAGTFGYSNDAAGYAQLQAAMVAHLGDAVVLENTKAAMLAACQRANVPTPNF